MEQGTSALVEFVTSTKNDIIADQFCYLLENIVYDPLMAEAIGGQEPVVGKHGQVLEAIK